MTKGFKTYLICALCSVVFIILSYIIARRMHLGAFSQLAFLLHLVPFAIGFSGGGVWMIYLYYIILWVIIMLIFKGLNSFVLTLKQ